MKLFTERTAELRYPSGVKRQIQLIVAVVLGAALLTTASQARAAVSQEQLVDMIARIQYAWYVEDLQELVSLSETLANDKARPALADWQNYYAAYGFFRAAALAEDDYLTEYLGRCEDITRTLLRKSPGFSEALILRGGCAAWLARARPISAVLAPSRAVRALAKASSIDPDNPRLLLQQAEAVIGRKAFADEYPQPISILEQAVTLFGPRADADPLTPDWGEVESHRYLAELLMAAGDKRRARDSLEQALQIAPDNRPAQLLMESLRGQR